MDSCKRSRVYIGLGLNFIHILTRIMEWIVHFFEIYRYIFWNDCALIYTCNLRYTISKCIHLAHISLASFLWDIGKQYKTRSVAAKRGVWLGSKLFAIWNFFYIWIKMKNTTSYPKIGNGLVQLIRVGNTFDINGSVTSKRQRYTFRHSNYGRNMTMVDFFRTLKTIAWKWARFHTWLLNLWLQTEYT